MRKPDWEQRLHQVIAASHEKPHAYGSHDCLIHSANVVKAVSGKDFARGHRGKYRTQLGAAKYLKRLGFDSPAAMIDSFLEEKPIGFAQRGDIVLVPGNAVPGGEPGWDIPGVCIGADALVIADDGVRQGLFRIPRALWLKAWAV